MWAYCPVNVPVLHILHITNVYNFWLCQQTGNWCHYVNAQLVFYRNYQRSVCSQLFPTQQDDYTQNHNTVLLFVQLTVFGFYVFRRREGKGHKRWTSVVGSQCTRLHTYKVRNKIEGRNEERKKKRNEWKRRKFLWVVKEESEIEKMRGGLAFLKKIYK